MNDKKDNLLYGEFHESALLKLFENPKTKKESVLIELDSDRTTFIQKRMIFPKENSFVVGISPTYSYKVRHYKDQDDFYDVELTGQQLFNQYIKGKKEIKKENLLDKLKNNK